MAKKTLKNNNGKIPSGISGLDELLGGGIEPGSIVAIAGTPGSGKTVISAGLFSSAVIAGFKGAVISFEENEVRMDALFSKFWAKTEYSFKSFGLKDGKKALTPVRGFLKKGYRVFFINSANAFAEASGKWSKSLQDLISVCKKNSAMLIIACPSGKPDGAAEELFNLSDTAVFLENQGGNGSITVIKSRGAEIKRGKFSLDIKGKDVIVGPAGATKPAGEVIMETLLNWQDPVLEGTVRDRFAEKFPGAFVRNFELTRDTSSESVSGLIDRRSDRKFDAAMVDLEMLRDVAEESLLLPLDNYFEKETLDKYSRFLINGLSVNGKLYGIPAQVTPYCLVYRKDLYKKHGIQPPQLWSEFVDGVKFIMNKEKNIKSGFVFSQRHTLNLFLNCLLNSTPDIRDIDTAVMDVHGIHYTRALSFLRDCRLKHGIIGGDILKGSISAGDEVVNGNAIAASYWGFGVFGKIIRLNAKLDERIGITNFPVREKGVSPKSLVYGTAYVVPATARNPGLGAEFIKYLSGPEGALKIRELGNYPTLTANREIDAELGKIWKQYEKAAQITGDAFFLRSSSMLQGLSPKLSGALSSVFDGSEGLSVARDRTAKILSGWRKTVYHSKTVFEAVKFMEINSAKKLSLKDISSAVSLSPTYFSFIFREKMKTSPVDYLIDLRIEAAKKLLREGNKYTVSQSAEKVGFQNSYYFTRMFRKKTGMTPTAYRYQDSKIV